jgi:cytoskeletal protein CcmA (bactofilin family)
MLFGSHRHNQLESGSVWRGHLTAKSMVDVNAPFEGTIQSTQEVIIRNGPSVVADITAGSLVIERGATFRGRLRIGRLPAVTHPREPSA